MRIFVSHAGHDGQWAEWVAWHLREAGYAIELDLWHWRTGEDFVRKMNDAMERASAVVALFSPQYFAPGRYTEEEWTAAVAGRDRFVPLVVEPLEAGQLPAILRPRIRQELHDLEEPAALEALLEAVRGREIPTTSPAFPGKAGKGTKSAKRSGPPAPQGLQPRFPSALHDPAVWDVRQRGRNPHFTGRDEIIEKVRRGLLSERRAAVRVLHGPGGVGKTQMALEYAHRFAGQYDLVWWVDAEQPEQVPARYAELAARVDVAKPDAGAEINARYALEHLRTSDRWLIVLDNAEDPRQLRTWLPEGSGHVLITARDPAWSKVVPGLALGVFSREESLGYLNRQLPTLSTGTADALADALGDLPLALAHAAGALGEGTPPDHYLQLLRTNTAELLNDGEVYDYPVSVAATVTIAAERLDAGRPEAAALLRLAAFLGPEPIPTKWLVEARGALTSVPGDPNDFRWPRNALQPLAQYGLAVVGPDAFQVHRLTQAVVRHAGGAGTGDTVQDVAALLAAIDPGDPELPEAWPEWASLTQHLTATLDAMIDRAELRPTLLKAARYLARNAQPEAALGLSEIMHAKWKASLGEDDPDTLRPAHMVALALHDMDLYEEFLSLVEDLLERRLRLLGKDHPDTLSTTHDVGVALLNLGRYVEAHGILQDAAARRQSRLGEDHVEALFSVASTGAALIELDRLDEAQRVLTDALARYHRTLNEHHPAALEAKGYLGQTMARLGRDVEALNIKEEVLALRRQLLGDRHRSTLFSADSLGVTLIDIGRYAEAERLLQSTRTRVRETLGTDHALYKSITIGLAQALTRQGKTHDAQRLRASLNRKKLPKKRPR
ncbi:toll/interleukin-1 receptor domain-containing protein [Streptomyces sp. uw30]|uniref:FxSxx-COOH system tetratricopeptide repeat protein n=1 Tax=Streptomyces sp. uw30 TaxID=1828179 RepID=UPI0011CDD81C|nr:FxSxx-COOH system tetratricopeptide repeat protein [Streptomyces sp. uw30]TXS43952.1 toll/interleukin-1 receptor domain-containing protein [Streptomyces sp. uw30]